MTINLFEQMHEYKNFMDQFIFTDKICEGMTEIASEEMLFVEGYSKEKMSELAMFILKIRLQHYYKELDSKHGLSKAAKDQELKPTIAIVSEFQKIDEDVYRVVTKLFY